MNNEETDASRAPYGNRRVVGAGALVVFEQHVKPLGAKVQRHTIPIIASGPTTTTTHKLMKQASRGHGIGQGRHDNHDHHPRQGLGLSPARSCPDEVRPAATAGSASRPTRSETASTPAPSPCPCSPSRQRWRCASRSGIWSGRPATAPAPAGRSATRPSRRCC